MMAWLFILAALPILIAVALAAFAGMVVALGALLGVGAGAVLGIGVVQGRKLLPPTQTEVPATPGTWLGAIAVSVLALAVGGAVNLLALVLWFGIRHAPEAELILMVAPLLGGALAGLCHVKLRRRSRSWILAWALGLGLPTYALDLVAFAMAGWAGDVVSETYEHQK
jgi:hypothetical protein